MDTYSKTADEQARTSTDPIRPTYHLMPTAGWMNDTNGAIWHDDWYHIFYLHSPGQDRPFNSDPKWITKVWSHARSRDLVHWQHLPVALTPPDPSYRCMSGSTIIHPDGRPLLYYSYSPILPGPVSQCLALGDEELLSWTHFSDGPILDLETHDGPDFEADWRDPYVFSHQGRTFLILGAVLDGEAVIPIYEAINAAWSMWAYRGIFLRLPKSDLRFFECPKFFRLEDKWILVVSPFGPVQYFTGTFDENNLVFEPQHGGIIDYGDCFYAAEDLTDPRGRQLLVGWIPGWNPVYHIGHGWNGLVSLPRVLTLSADGELQQNPIPELAKLRGAHFHLANRQVVDETYRLDEVHGDTLELKVQFEAEDASRFGLKLRLSDEGEGGVEIVIANQAVTVAGKHVPLPQDKSPQLSLHLFLDKCVLELFVNEGARCLTHLFTPTLEDDRIALFASGGSVLVRSLDVWQINQ